MVDAVSVTESEAIVVNEFENNKNEMTKNEVKKDKLVSNWIETLSPESMKKLLFDCVMELIVTECVNIRPKESQDDEYGGIPYWECNGGRLVS